LASSSAWNRHIVADPAKANHCAWSPLVFQKGWRPCTWPPDCSQYCSIATSEGAGPADPEAGAADDDANDGELPDPAVAGDDGVVAAGVPPDPHPARRTPAAAAIATRTVRLDLIGGSLE